MNLRELIERLQRIEARHPDMAGAHVLITVEVEDLGRRGKLVQHEQPVSDVACVVPTTKVSSSKREPRVYILGPGI